MSSKTKVSSEQIETFLQGSDPQKFIVSVEPDYIRPSVTLIVNDPVTGKRLETHNYKPFLWIKEEGTTMLYGGKRMKLIDACSKYDVKFTKLRTSNDDGVSPQRLLNGYKFLVTCKKSYNDLVNFFKEGELDVFDRENSKYFVMFNPTEQFLIQSGKRLFKGMDDYDNLHRFQFDLETEGLHASKHAIFQIGVRDNRGLEGVLETTGDDGYMKRDSERINIDKFFKIIDMVKPDIITGYNSENFDWPFLFERAERLSIPITELAITLNRMSKIRRKPSTLKVGGETVPYNQTLMYGYNIIDVSHAVRRAMAINSEIKAWGLKYITKYSEIAKPNRIYVQGDKINTTWADKVNKYALDDNNGDWYKISETNPLKDGYKIVTGALIVQRYLCDDLWETEQIDNIFNQASFLIAKMLPTTFQRSSTMGTAGQWKLIMAAWSYQNGLAIPETQAKRDFTGGLSRLLELGFAKNVVKFDYAALYPKTQLTNLIFPDLDISGVMEGMLTYVVDTRDEAKFLTSKHKEIAKTLDAKLKAEKYTMSMEDIEVLKEEINKEKALSNLYDKKQLPLKILANSWFGSYGATHIFNWGDVDSAEETTCRGRQYLREMVEFFTLKYGFKALVLDTDGCNFSYPETINNVKYIAKGSHWKTIDYAGKELVGVDGVLAEFNENHMQGRMGLDIDDEYTSTINFSRKNYANLTTGGKIKLVGNSIKSKKMSIYIEEFLGNAIGMLLNGDGYSFIKYYYEYVDKIYNYQIPLVKIASKAKIKNSIKDYKKKALLRNKAGNLMPKQAHMELVIKNDIDVDLDDIIYYINTGSAKSHGDLKTQKDKETGTLKVTLNCKLIENSVVEKDFELIKELDMLNKALSVMEYSDTNNTYIKTEARIEELKSELITDEYNVARYLDSFNKKIKPLLVCFNPSIRDNILLEIVKIKDKTTKKVTEKLKERMIFTKGECELVSGIPRKPTDQDSYEELMTMEDKEIKFWDRVNKLPNNMEQSKWDVIRADYLKRMVIVKEEGVKNEKESIDKIIKRLEIKDIRNTETGVLPLDIFIIADLSTEQSGVLISRKWNEPLCELNDIFKYEKEAIERDEYYKLTGSENIDERYEQWLDYSREKKAITGDTTNVNIEPKNINTISELVKGKSTPIKKEESKKKKIASENEEDIEDDDDTIRGDETIKLDDDVDDTKGDKPEDYIDVSETTISEPINPIDDNPVITKLPTDEWNF